MGSLRWLGRGRDKVPSRHRAVDAQRRPHASDRAAHGLGLAHQGRDLTETRERHEGRDLGDSTCCTAEEAVFAEGMLEADVNAEEPTGSHHAVYVNHRSASPGCAG